MIGVLNVLVPTAQASTASHGSLKQSRLLEIDVEKHHPDLFRQRWLTQSSKRSTGFLPLWEGKKTRIPFREVKHIPYEPESDFLDPNLFKKALIG